MKENLDLPLEMQLTFEQAKRHIESVNDVATLRKYCLGLLKQRLFVKNCADTLVNQTRQVVELQQQELLTKTSECEFYKFLLSNLSDDNQKR